MRRFAVTVIALFVAVPVFAQAPFPGAVLVNGGWVPCSHPIAIAAGKGCGVTTPPAVVVKPVTAPMIVGRYYRNANSSCLVRTLALAVTHLHRVPMIVAERVDPGSYGCAEVAYWFRADYPPDGNWYEVSAASLGVDW